MMILILCCSVFVVICGALLTPQDRQIGFFFLAVGIVLVIITLIKMKGGAR